MIAIARKRKQNSAYTTNGEARAGFPIRASTFLEGCSAPAELIFGRRTERDYSLARVRHLNPLRVCVCKGFAAHP